MILHRTLFMGQGSASSMKIPSHFNFALWFFRTDVCFFCAGCQAETKTSSRQPFRQSYRDFGWATRPVSAHWGESVGEVIRSIPTVFVWNVQLKKCCEREAAYFDRRTYFRSCFLNCSLTGKKRASVSLSLCSIESFLKLTCACMQINLNSPTFFEVGPRPASSEFASGAAITPEPPCLKDSIVFGSFRVKRKPSKSLRLKWQKAKTLTWVLLSIDFKHVQGGGETRRWRRAQACRPEWICTQYLSRVCLVDLQFWKTHKDKSGWAWNSSRRELQRKKLRNLRPRRNQRPKLSS